MVVVKIYRVLLDTLDIGAYQATTGAYKVTIWEPIQ